MRTQIDLESEQHALAKRKAADLGISMAEYICQLVAQDLDHPGPDSDISIAATLITAIRSGRARAERYQPHLTQITT